MQYVTFETHYGVMSGGSGFSRTCFMDFNKSITWNLDGNSEKKALNELDKAIDVLKEGIPKYVYGVYGSRLTVQFSFLPDGMLQISAWDVHFPHPHTVILTINGKQQLLDFLNEIAQKEKNPEMTREAIFARWEASIVKPKKSIFQKLFGG